MSITVPEASVTVLNCVWQTRLQRRGSPLVDCVEHRLLCVLEPSRPVVAVVANQRGPWVVMTKEFRRKDVLQDGDLVALRLTFAQAYDRGIEPNLILDPTRERTAEKALKYPDALWRPARFYERPRGAKVFLNTGIQLPIGKVVLVASMASGVNAHMVFVDLDDVKRLVGGRWRVRKAAIDRYPQWIVLTTGRVCWRMSAAAFDDELAET